MNEFIPTRETVERIKDIICNDVKGCVFDHHVADALNISYDKLRVAIYRNNTPIKEIVGFCYRKNIIINDLIFNKEKPTVY